ncbi:MAG: SPOR domain-containing protein [Acidobacteriota bacterium]
MGSSSGKTAEGDAPRAEPSEFEFVLGRRQIASVSFLLLVVVACLGAAGYWGGKASARVVEVVVPAPLAIAPTPAIPTLVAAAVVPDEPVFGTPLKGPVYLQLGSVEKGFATLMVQGARKMGYSAFVGGGANQNVYRVLVGPFKNAAEYEKAKAEFDALGLATFSRKYQE